MEPHPTEGTRKPMAVVQSCPKAEARLPGASCYFRVTSHLTLSGNLGTLFLENAHEHIQQVYTGVRRPPHGQAESSPQLPMFCGSLVRSSLPGKPNPETQRQLSGTPTSYRLPACCVPGTCGHAQGCRTEQHSHEQGLCLH